MYGCIHEINRKKLYYNNDYVNWRWEANIVSALLVAMESEQTISHGNYARNYDWDKTLRKYAYCIISDAFTFDIVYK